MKIEHGIYSLLAIGALGSAYWAAMMFWSGPDFIKAIAFSDYSTISHPLFRKPDYVRIEETPVADELTTGSIPVAKNDASRSVGSPPDVHLLGVYDGVALVAGKSGKVRAVVRDTVLPNLGRVLAISKVRGDWQLITEFGVVRPQGTKKNEAPTSREDGLSPE